MTRNGKLLVAGAIAALALAAGGGSGVYLALSGSSCGDTICSPSDSFQAAYVAAASGATITVAPGTYPAQTLKLDSTKGSTPVTFKADGNVTISGARSLILGDDTNATNVGPHNIAFEGFHLDGDAVMRRGTAGATLEDVTADRFLLTGVTNVAILGGSYGPKNNDVNLISGCQGCPFSTGITIDGVTLHDVTVSYPPGTTFPVTGPARKHSECLLVQPANDVVVRNSIMQNCTDFGVLMHPPTGFAMKGITIENDQIDKPFPGGIDTQACNPDCPRSGNSISLGAGGNGMTNVRIDYNSALGGISTSGVTDTPVRIANATNPAWFVDPNTQDGTMNLDLVAGAGAIDTGDPADFPATDIHGTVRPIGNGPDQGADEYGASEPPPTTTTSTTTTTTTTSTSSTTTSTSSTTTTQPPPPTSHCPDGGTSLAVQLVSETPTTVTLGWTPPPATRAYLFSRQGYVKPDGSQRFPSSLNPALAQVTFAKADWYCVEALSVAKDGGYP